MLKYNVLSTVKKNKAGIIEGKKVCEIGLQSKWGGQGRPPWKVRVGQRLEERD